MIKSKKEIPDESEIVLCTVTKVQYHSVFVNLDEYGKQGMLHISEIAPGRIRNIRDYVKEGKVIICTVLRIDHERGHIDVSLRRVTDMQRKHKLDMMKQEQKAEKIIEMVAHELKMDKKKVYTDIALPILQKYDLLHPCFSDVVNKGVLVKDIGVPKQYQEALERAIHLRIKPPEVFLKGKFSILSYDGNGIEIIKQAFQQALTKKNVALKYLGGGKYGVTIKHEDYKSGEKLLKEITTSTLHVLQKHNTIAEFIREEAK